jgi:hypothetical protein
MEDRLRDQGLQALLKELALFNNGLCLISTRCKVPDYHLEAARLVSQQ